MFYQLKPAFAPIQEKPAEGVPWVEVISQQEMDSQVTQHPYLARSLRHGHSCKAELFDHCAAGALLSGGIDELGPEAYNEHSNAGTLAALAGFLLMMVLDVALG